MKGNWLFICRTVFAVLLASLSLGGARAKASRAETITGIRYVKTGGTGDCSSWVQACGMQTALGSAASGDEIWVAEGIYYPGESGNAYATFKLRQGVAIYGGFAGTETNRNQRDWTRHITTLSGDIDHNDKTDASGIVTDTLNVAGRNSYHVVFGDNLDASAVLDGFYITGGQADDIYSHCCPDDRLGGGVLVQYSSPILAHINLSGNMAINGGGMYNYGSGNPALTSVTFSGNSAVSKGGGMVSDGHPTLNLVTFTGNSAAVSGGMDSTGSPNLSHVIFSENSADSYGGGMSSWGSPTLTEVIFSKNTAGSTGGGMHSGCCGTPSLTRVSFLGNSAGEGGGGIFNLSDSKMLLINVAFTDNSTEGRGGGMYNWGSSPTLSNVTFFDNQAGNGGGMFNYDQCIPRMTNVTFYGNSAVSSGGGIENLASYTTLSNAILWGNSAPISPQISNAIGTITVTHSIIQGGFPGTGNLNVDPQFINADLGILLPGPESPAIDSGDNEMVLPGIITDMAGMPRFVDDPAKPDTGVGVPPVVDRGAFEFQLPDLYLPVVRR